MIRRLAAAAALAVAALTLLGSARAAPEVPEPAQQTAPVATVTPETTPHPAAPRVYERAAVQVVQAPRPAPVPSHPLNAATITLSPVTALYSQAAVDRGRLVTWMTDPVCLLAGHDTRGWNWIDDIAIGRTVVVTSGPCAGRYRVAGHRWQSVKGGPIPAWMSDPSIDLVLQTCTGATGMGFSILVRTSLDGTR
jgi:hypothetical protein